MCVCHYFVEIPQNGICDSRYECFNGGQSFLFFPFCWLLSLREEKKILFILKVIVQM